MLVDLREVCATVQHEEVRAFSPCMLDSVNTVKVLSVYLRKGNCETLLGAVPYQWPIRISPGNLRTSTYFK